jgi:hypothetical protein
VSDHFNQGIVQVWQCPDCERRVRLPGLNTELPNPPRCEFGFNTFVMIRLPDEPQSGPWS